MFKDLFQATNKSKGIAGIQNVKISSKGGGVIHDEGAPVADLDLSMNGGPKLLPSKKTDELQALALLDRKPGQWFKPSVGRCGESRGGQRGGGRWYRDRKLDRRRLRRGLQCGRERQHDDGPELIRQRNQWQRRGLAVK